MRTSFMGRTLALIASLGLLGCATPPEINPVQQLPDLMETLPADECSEPEAERADPHAMRLSSEGACWTMRSSSLGEVARRIELLIAESDDIALVATDCRGFDRTLLAGLIVNCMVVIQNPEDSSLYALALALDDTSTTEVATIASEIYEEGSVEPTDLEIVGGVGIDVLLLKINAEK